MTTQPRTCTMLRPLGLTALFAAPLLLLLACGLLLLACGSTDGDQGDRGTSQGDRGTSQGDGGTSQGDRGTAQADVGTSQGDGGSYDTNPNRMGPAPVSLGSASGLGAAGSYVVLAKTGITNVTGSTITGDLGLSPAAASYMTGFALVADSTNAFSTSPSVVGKIYASDYAPPTPSNLTSAVGSMETAYTDAAGRVSPDFTELSSGNIGGLTLQPGLYKWSTSVMITQDVTLSGGAADTWIFQVSGDLSIDAAKRVILAGGARSQNVVWQVAGEVSLGTTSHFEGIILSQTAVTMKTNASMNGRIFSQSLVALDDNVVTQP